MRLSGLLLLCMMLLGASAVRAQEYVSNADLMAVKEESEARRFAWNKAFDEGVQLKSFAALPPLREASEMFIEEQLRNLQRMYAEGDARSLITALTNYLQIQKVYIRDVMKAVEAITPANEAEIAGINQKISDFAKKERIFLIEINNALASSPEAPRPARVDPEMDQEEESPEAPSTRERSKKQSKKEKKQEEEEAEEDE